jgi:hypothetical protein
MYVNLFKVTLLIQLKNRISRFDIYRQGEIIRSKPHNIIVDIIIFITIYRKISNLGNAYKLAFQIIYGEYMNVFECSTIDIAPTISRVLKIPMVPPSGRPIPEVENCAKERGCKRAGIIVVDSLGYSLYRHLSPVM